MIESVGGILSPHMLRSTLCWKVPILLRYGIIFGGGGEGDSIKVFKIQKRMLRIIGGLGKREWWRLIF
jgi:hypothetical protein